jgi:hypothetical protein
VFALAAGCGATMHPLLPADIPRTDWVAYDDGAGHTLSGPRGGGLVPGADDLDLRYESGATVTLSAVNASAIPISEGNIVNALRAIKGLGSAHVMKEAVADAEIYCVERADRLFAACARADDALRAESTLLLATLSAPANVYLTIGGPRFCAEVLKSARGFHARAVLPAP